MKLRNTLSKNIEEVTPLKDNSLRIYTCGPTVYDHAHIGNMVSFIFADTLNRVLKSQGFKVEHVMNYTDIDDKTVARSQELYPDKSPMEALKALGDKYIATFLKDMQAVGNQTEGVITFMRATDNIEAMQALIRELVEKGFAYIAEDGVYFSIDAYIKSGKKYGQLSEISRSNVQARIQNDEYDKEAAQDFALWKRQKDNEPAWDFDLNAQNIPGRPGWHIECSAMSSKQLGRPFDIHTGGIDLIFPHHENEIAQSTAGQDDPIYSKIFAHSEHLLINGQKMSKSLNNFYTVETIKEKGFDPLAFRLLVLQARYSSQVHFSWENLAAAQNRLNEFRAMAALRWQPRNVAHDSGTFALEEIPLHLSALLSNDLDTPQALAFLSNATTQLLTVHIERDMADHFVGMLEGIDALLGLELSKVSDINDHQKKLIEEREEARRNQDWKRADEIRDELYKQKIGLQDHAHGVTWYPV